MIWLTWRQFRAQAVTTAVALALFAALLVSTRPRMASLYAASGIAGCRTSSCAGLPSGFLNQLASTTPFSGHALDPLPDGFNLYPFVYTGSILLILLAPAIVGIFWGAPLIARELENGTGRLTWNQSITRTRWLTVKLTLIAAAAMAVTEAFSQLQSWWATPIGRAMGLGGSASVFTGNRFSPLAFVTHGIAPLGYAAFGFTLGAAAGLLIRRTVPAMAVTLAVFTAVQLAMPLWVRPNLIPPQHATVAIGRDVTFGDYGVRNSALPGFTLTTGGVPGQPGAWVTGSGAVDRAGQPVRILPAACAQPANQPGASVLDCLDGQGIRIALSYQPASRYWAVQAAETGILLVLAAGLAGFCFWRLGRRRT
jgi:ABC-2 family transporter protein